MINIVKAKKADEFVELCYGDIVEMSNGTYLMISCDGYGHYFLVNLSDEGFILAKNHCELYKVNANTTVKIGGNLFYSDSVTIVQVHKKENVSIEVKLS